MRAFSPNTRISTAQAAVAWVLAGLVFALGLLSASPQAHAHLHEHAIASHAHEQDQASASGHDHTHTHAAPSAHDDLGCAITLFQQGVTAPLDMPSLALPVSHEIVELASASEQQPLSAARYLLRPVRGPPCIG